ncbi:PspA-associated protein PspAB [Actinocrinis sp.]|jgi:hypothetical protein|uniref:PspA-associated protein PspAB n=1 Tax=Actinocrinis sp. TaxID=1920516 RepID=UPI002C67F8FF|nr:hypothetical protein [Actinocrinis sp.]HXR69232.1 hypothetical protein [Actinocrinis sp.]
MGFLDTLLGRTKPVQPNLDHLFAVPNAALTLEVSLGFKPTGYGAVCYRKAEGGAFAQVEADVEQLIEGFDGPKVEASKDKYGFTWLLVRRDSEQLSDLVTDVHAVNSSLQDNGFGPYLLCSLIYFEDPQGRKLALVYLYKKGTFYPFAPQREPHRDNVLELQVKTEVGTDLPLEKDLTRWMALWGAAGL